MDYHLVLMFEKEHFPDGLPKIKRSSYQHDSSYESEEGSDEEDAKKEEESEEKEEIEEEQILEDIKVSDEAQDSKSIEDDVPVFAQCKEIKQDVVTPDLSIPSFAPVRSAPACVSAPPSRETSTEGTEDQKLPSQDDETEDDDSEGDICMEIEEEVIVANDSPIIILPQDPPIFADSVYSECAYMSQKNPVYTPAKRKYSELEGDGRVDSFQKVVKKTKIEAEPVDLVPQVTKKRHVNGYRHQSHYKHYAYHQSNGEGVETPRRMHEMHKYERKEAYRRDDDEYVVDEDYMPGGRRDLKSKANHYRLRGRTNHLRSKHSSSKNHKSGERILKLKKARHTDEEPTRSRRKYKMRSRTSHLDQPIRNRRAKKAKATNPDPPKPRRPRNRRASKMKQQALMKQEASPPEPEQRRTRDRRKRMKLVTTQKLSPERKLRDRRARSKLIKEKEEPKPTQQVPKLKATNEEATTPKNTNVTPTFTEPSPPTFTTKPTLQPTFTEPSPTYTPVNTSAKPPVSNEISPKPIIPPKLETSPLKVKKVTKILPPKLPPKASSAVPSSFTHKLKFPPAKGKPTSKLLSNLHLKLKPLPKNSKPNVPKKQLIPPKSIPKSVPTKSPYLQPIPSLQRIPDLPKLQKVPSLDDPTPIKSLKRTLPINGIPPKRRKVQAPPIFPPQPYPPTNGRFEPPNGFVPMRMQPQPMPDFEGEELNSLNRVYDFVMELHEKTNSPSYREAAEILRAHNVHWELLMDFDVDVFSGILGIQRFHLKYIIQEARRRHLYET